MDEALGAADLRDDDLAGEPQRPGRRRPDRGGVGAEGQAIEAIGPTGEHVDATERSALPVDNRPVLLFDREFVEWRIRKDARGVDMDGIAIHF